MGVGLSVLKRGAALLAVASVPAVLLAQGTACQHHRCDPPLAVFLDLEKLDEDTYQTGAIDEPWVSYPGIQALVLRFPKQPEGRRVVLVDAYVSVTQDQRTEGSNFTRAAGDLTIVRYANANEGEVHVLNRTCEHFYFRAIVRLGGPLPSGDASAE
jgi:hypothetical protein